MSENVNSNNTVVNNSQEVQPNLNLFLNLNKQTVTTLNSPDMGGGMIIMDGDDGEGIFSIGQRCKAKKSKRKPTQCGDATTGNTASGNCTCKEVCGNIARDLGGVFAFNNGVVSFNDNALDF